MLCYVNVMLISCYNVKLYHVIKLCYIMILLFNVMLYSYASLCYGIVALFVDVTLWYYILSWYIIMLCYVIFNDLICYHVMLYYVKRLCYIMFMLVDALLRKWSYDMLCENVYVMLCDRMLMPCSGYHDILCYVMMLWYRNAS